MGRVLIIDDDRMIRREVHKALSKSGFEVLEAAEPGEGIGCAIRDQPDLILLDVMMPGMDGIAVLRQLREHASTSQIPVIMVTSFGAQDQVAACIEEGAVDHITKPFSHKQLCDRVAIGVLKVPGGPTGDAIRARATAEKPSHSARIIAVLGAKGGVGATTIAANAASVATEHSDSVILCEMRRTFGTLSLQLNAQPRDHLGTLTKTLQEMRFVACDSFLVRDSSGLRILFGPQPEDGELSLDAGQVERLMKALAPLADLIFLDLAAGLTQLNAEVLKIADCVVLVLDCEPTSIAAAKAIVDQLQSTSIRRTIKVVIVNRTELSITPKIGEIDSLLGCDLIGVVPRDADALAHAVKTGAILATLRPNDLVSEAVRQLTESHLLVERHAAAAP